MNRFLILLCASVTVVAVAGCASRGKSSSVDAAWISNMHKMSNAHLRLMPLAVDGSKFSDPASRETIKKSLTQMAEASNQILNDNKAPDADPLIQYTAAQLAGEVKQAFTAFEMNDLQASRFSLSRASNYCISCHTRGDRGVRDFELGWPAELSSFNPLLNVELLLANRQYRSAMAAARKLAADGTTVKRDPRSWILAIEKVLGMAVRVNKDPAQARELVTLVLNNKAAPYYIRRDASAWLDDIQQWAKESASGRKRTDFASLVKIVDRAQKSGPYDSTALIRYLRASGLAHELLENTRSPKYAETLFYAGIVAAALRDLNMGYLDQYYYESCIDSSPHSELGEKCFSRLEASVRAANPLMEIDPSTAWPSSARLNEYRKLAEVQDMINDPRWNRRFWEEFEKFEEQDKNKTPR